jgi:hypothetical protein
MKIKKIQSLRNSVCEVQQKLNDKLEQFKCPRNWKLMCNEYLEIVLVNKLDGKTYNIPKVFSEYKVFSDDDIESIISMNQKLSYEYLR